MTGELKLTKRTRHACDEDMVREANGRPVLVCVSFFHELGTSRERFVYCGFRRPFKKKNKWFVRRYFDVPLQVREEQGRTSPSFVA